MKAIRSVVVALTLAVPCSAAFAAQRSSSALNESEMHVGSGYTGQEWQGNTTAKKPKKLIIVGPRLSADEEHATSEFVLIVPDTSSHEGQGNTTAKKPRKLIIVGPRLSADEEHATSEFVLIVPDTSSHENVSALYERPNIPEGD